MEYTKRRRNDSTAGGQVGHSVEEKGSVFLAVACFPVPTRPAAVGGEATRASRSRSLRGDPLSKNAHRGGQTPREDSLAAHNHGHRPAADAAIALLRARRELSGATHRIACYRARDGAERRGRCCHLDGRCPAV